MPRQYDDGFWTRLKEAMAEAGYEPTKTRAAKLIGLHQTSATKWSKGGLPSMSNVRDLAGRLNVCVEWLLTGRGPKKPLPQAADDYEELISIQEEVAPEVREEILRYAKYLRDRG